MALTLILFKVSNIMNLPKSQSEINADQATTETPTAHLVADENTNLLSAKVVFRGIYLYNILIKEKREYLVICSMKNESECFRSLSNFVRILCIYVP
jgi:hypothetical protein